MRLEGPAKVRMDHRIGTVAARVPPWQQWRLNQRIQRIIDRRLAERLPLIGIPYPPRLDTLEYGPGWKGKR